MKVTTVPICPACIAGNCADHRWDIPIHGEIAFCRCEACERK